MRQRGFTLIELSIVLAIIAVIVGTALTTGQNRMSFAQLRHTHQKLDKIEEALAAYLQLNGDLPCPADGSLDEDDAAFGVPDCVGTLVDIADPDILIGSIPVQALNLSDEFAVDGWDRRFTYVLDSLFINSISFVNSPAGSLTVEDGAGNNRTSEAIAALLSHGANGHGAWPKNGGAVRVDTSSADTGEQDNANDPANNPSFIDPAFTDKSFVQSVHTGTFDDIVRFKVKQQIAHDAGKWLVNDPCPDAKRTLLPIKDDPAATSAADLPLEGAVGCQIDTGGGYPWASYNTECIARQLHLAETVADLCL